MDFCLTCRTGFSLLHAYANLINLPPIACLMDHLFFLGTPHGSFERQVSRHIAACGS